MRLANHNDLPRLCELGQEFYTEAKLPGTFNPESFTSHWATMFDLGNGSVHVVEQDGKIAGAAGAVRYTDLYTGDVCVAELFWFVTGSQRGIGLPLFKGMEDWAKAQGAKRFLMVHLNNLSPDILTRLYQKRGYKEIETHFMKELK